MKSLLLAISSLVFSFSALSTNSPQEAEPSSRLIESYTRAKALDRVPPKFPRRQAKLGQDGWVQLSFVIDEEGKVKDVIPLDHGGSKSFVKSAIRAVKQWQYSPAIVDGKPVEQCSNSVQLDFALARGAAVQRRFRVLFKQAEEAVENKDFDTLEMKIKEMDGLRSLNITELFWRNYLAILMFDAKGLSHNRYWAMNRTLRSLKVISGDDHDNIKRYLLQEKFIYETENALFANALTSYNRMNKEFPEYAKTFTPYSQQVKDLIATDEPIYVKAYKNKGGNWHHKLVRNQFAVTDLEGEINKLEVRCDKKRSIFTFDINSSWTIPESWGQCSVFLDTEAKTKFTFVEMNS